MSNRAETGSCNNAAEVGQLVPGFGRASYPGWDELFSAWWERTPAGDILHMDAASALRRLRS